MITISNLYKNLKSYDDLFDKLKSDYSCSFPAEFKFLINKYNGVEFDSIIELNNENVQFIFGFSEDTNDSDYDLISNIKIFKDSSENRAIQLIPFGCDYFGNLFCFHQEDHSVYFWDHESNNGNVNEIGTKIANNFTEFIVQLIEQNGGYIKNLSEICAKLKK